VAVAKAQLAAGGHRTFFAQMTAHRKPRKLQAELEVLTTRLSEIPVDTLLYIAITRATWGLCVVEPHAKRFVEHYVIGVEGRRRSREDEPFLVRSSVDEGKAETTEKLLHGGLLLRDPASTAKVMNMSGKDLALMPECVFEMGDTEVLDLSVNNLRRLPSKLWALPLRELNLSHNPCLGRVLLPALREAARCTSLEILELRDVVTEGGTAAANGGC